MVTECFFVYSDFFQWIQYLIAKLMFLTSNWTLSRKEAWFAAWWSGTIGQIRQKCKKKLILDMILNRNFCHVFYLRILDFSGCLGEKGWTFWKSKMLVGVKRYVFWFLKRSFSFTRRFLYILDCSGPRCAMPLVDK